MTVSRSIHVTANGIISFFLVAAQYFIVYTHRILFIHSSVDGYLGCFHVFTIVLLNVGVHVSFWIMFLPGYTPSSGIWGHVIALFLVLKGTSLL